MLERLSLAARDAAAEDVERSSSSHVIPWKKRPLVAVGSDPSRRGRGRLLGRALVRIQEQVDESRSTAARRATCDSASARAGRARAVQRRLAGHRRAIRAPRRELPASTAIAGSWRRWSWSLRSSYRARSQTRAGQPACRPRARSGPRGASAKQDACDRRADGRSVLREQGSRTEVIVPPSKPASTRRPPTGAN